MLPNDLLRPDHGEVDVRRRAVRYLLKRLWYEPLMLVKCELVAGPSARRGVVGEPVGALPPVVRPVEAGGAHRNCIKCDVIFVVKVLECRAFFCNRLQRFSGL